MVVVVCIVVVEEIVLTVVALAYCAYKELYNTTTTIATKIKINVSFL